MLLSEKLQGFRYPVKKTILGMFTNRQGIYMGIQTRFSTSKSLTNLISKITDKRNYLDQHHLLRFQNQYNPKHTFIIFISAECQMVGLKEKILIFVHFVLQN